MEMAGSSNAPDVSTPTHDMKFMQASNINVSNFVSVKLSGLSNYKIWKAQMLCLIKSQVLLHIIDANHPFPVDKDVHMIEQYNELVKGWIFGSVNENELKDLVDMGTAQEVWMKLESLFNLPVSDTEGVPSNVIDVSTRTEDLRYMLASNVDVSDFVSVKLTNYNYDVWKSQILCLIESHDLLHIIHAKARFPWDKGDPMTQAYDKLVRGWILNTITNYVLEDFHFYRSVQLLWRNLELRSASAAELSLPASAELCSPSKRFAYTDEADALIYKQASNIKVSNFVPVKLSVRLYYHVWKDQMLRLIESQDLLHVIHINIRFPKSECDKLVKDWILGSMNEELVKDFTDCDSAKDLWTKLESHFTDGDSWPDSVVSASTQDLKYTQASTVNVSNFISVKLSGQSNYPIWKLQMLFLIKSQELVHVIQQEGLRILVKYDNLVKGWIFSTMSEDLFKEFIYLEDYPVSYVWNWLANIYDRPKSEDLAETLLKESPNIAMENEEMLKAITTTFPTDLGFRESLIYPSFHYVCQKTVVRCSLLFHPDRCVDNILRVVKICNNTGCNLLGKNSVILLVLIATLYPIYQLICLLILLLHLSFSMLYLLLWKVLAITVPPIKNIEKKRKEYKKAKNILSLICKMKGPSDVGYSDSFFEAVRQDRYEVVDEILMNSPDTINLKDADGYNIIQLSIMNRAEKVYNLIYHIIERTKSRGEMTDSSSNNLAHLAGRLAPSFVLSRTTGAALQLQRELLWFKEVERLMLPLKLMEKNIYNETPVIVFAREHHDLLKQGEIWMKTTAESSSITAALIVTVAFAAAITVPGGSNQESGIPVFGKEIPFIVFAVSNASSLFTGVTALLLFLSTILTASSSEKDFQVILPRRLIFGLVMLFLSAITMMVAFGAIFFLVFCDRRPWMLAPIAVFACWPILVIVAIKLPLLANLIQSTFFPLFGEKSYLKSCNINKKNTIFI
ncbi:uncharacterized protein LOC110928794 isoform X4 [Helianthus annuus]|uniref:uncharacterized protein LOC110928794 isoform X4 n=1 Tax=Helianthus annuus TaxID=4232 RepID=UPI001653308B|nr:uncharacterized protein LOC110928794 isoform X4 [Helianthus annuus]